MMALTARAASPGEAVVRGAIDSLKALPATKGQPDAQRKLLDSIDNALALDLLARQALGPQWAKLNEVERRRFMATFTASLEKLAFPRAAVALSQIKVTYLGDDKKGSAGVVRTTIAKDDGGKVPVDFVVARRGARWQITDVTMDGESLSKAVSTRIQGALNQEGYQKLVEELQKRVAEADAGP
jgi:ABC-type transporter MlaC component